MNNINKAQISFGRKRQHSAKKASKTDSFESKTDGKKKEFSSYTAEKRNYIKQFAGIGRKRAGELSKADKSTYELFEAAAQKGISPNFCADLALCKTRYPMNAEKKNKAVTEIISNLEGEDLELFKKCTDEGYSALVYQNITNNDYAILLVKCVMLDNFDYVEFSVFVDKNGIRTTRTSDFFHDKVQEGHNKNSTRSVTTNFLENSDYEEYMGFIPRTIKNKIEVLCDENKEPIKVIGTLPSKNLEGAYEKTEYTLSNYPTDMDIPASIANGTIKGGRPISKTTVNNDGSVTYCENYSTPTTDTKRKYTELQNENGRVIKSSLDYKIKDKNGFDLMDLSRTFEKVRENETLTIVNGEEFKVKFDDENLKLEIVYNDNYSDTISLKSLVAEHEEGELEKFYELLKETPGDIILSIALGCPMINLVENSKSSCDMKSGKLDLGTKYVDTIAHEVGHLNQIQSILADDPKLIEIYNRETDYLIKNLTQEEFGLIKYLSPYEISAIGIDEAIAETNLVLSCHGSKDGLSARSNMFIQHFPETIAYIAKRTGYGG